MSQARNKNRKEIQIVQPTVIPLEASQHAPQTDNTPLSIFMANMISAHTEASL